MALCVSLCPTEELKTYQDLKRFAMLNGEVGERSVRACVRACHWSQLLSFV